MNHNCSFNDIDIDKMTLANQRMGHTLQMLIELKKEEESRDMFLNAAYRLTDAMILGRKYNVIDENLERTIVDDMEFNSEEFLHIFSDEEDAIINFMHVFTADLSVARLWARVGVLDGVLYCVGGSSLH